MTSPVVFISDILLLTLILSVIYVNFHIHILNALFKMRFSLISIPLNIQHTVEDFKKIAKTKLICQKTWLPAYILRETNLLDKWP